MADLEGENQRLNEPRSQASPAAQKAPFPYAKPLAGACVGVLAGFVLSQLIFAGTGQFLPALGAVAGAFLGFVRLWRLVWAIGYAAAVAILIIAYTPLVPWLVSTPPEADQLEPADAVVALGAGVYSDGSLGCHSRDRSLHALELLREGYGKELVLPVAADSWVPAVREQMARLGLNYPIDAPGTVANTHDEAMVVARLAKQRGWRRVILVTNAWHMRRAAATFQKSGVDVLRSPCSDSSVDMIHPTGLGDNLKAFVYWLHEAIGYRVYRARGWVE